MKEKILQQAFDLFMKYGIRSISMDDIAKNLSISKKTIYQYFKDKEEIICLIANQIIDETRLQIQEIDKTSNDAIEKLFKISVCVRETHKNVKDTVLYDLKKYYPEAWGIFETFKYEVLLPSIEFTMTQGMEEGCFRQGIAPDVLAILRIEEVQMVYENEALINNERSIQEIHSQLFDHFVHGLLSPEGLQKFNNLKEPK
ncbi:MAG: TetR/AcrR family transcriptional regulator [Cyclobacteriaceae bacterium]